MKSRVIIRGFAGKALVFEDRIEISEDQLDALIPGLVDKHQAALASHRPYVIEIEFPDEPDPLQRFFRFGTDPRGMVAPLKIDLKRP